MNEKIVAILPAYNQEGNISELINNVKKYVSEIIVVSDGSTDNTAKFAAESSVIAPTPINKRGKGNAVIRGISISKSLNPDIILLMDSDGQHDPKEIPKLLEPIIKGQADMVIGSRFLGVLKTSNINKVGNYLLNLLHFLLTFRWVTDVESGYRAFKAEKLYNLNLTALRYEVESDTLLEAIDKKLRIKEVPIITVKEEKGITLLDGFRIGKFVIFKKLRSFLK